MTDAGVPQYDLGDVLHRFAADAEVVSRLILEDETFRALCEDYALTKNTLRRFEATNRAQDASKIADYFEVLLDLEHDIAKLIAKAKQVPPTEVG